MTYMCAQSELSIVESSVYWLWCYRKYTDRVKRKINSYVEQYGNLRVDEKRNGHDPLPQVCLPIIYIYTHMHDIYSRGLSFYPSCRHVAYCA
jgi:hypothetical protein